VNENDYSRTPHLPTNSAGLREGFKQQMVKKRASLIASQLNQRLKEERCTV
jgi:hypothetical protein